jgi:hypothetical protein
MLPFSLDCPFLYCPFGIFYRLFKPWHQLTENVLQNAQHDLDTLQLSYFGTLLFPYFPDRVQSSKVLFIVGKIKTITHKLSIAFQTDMHNNKSTTTPRWYTLIGRR